MDYAAWAYPWDLREEGVAAVADRLTGIGVDEVNLATNYHSVQAFCPHNPERRTFFARASSYFQPGDGYGRLEPTPYPGMDGEDWVDETASAAADHGLSVTSWTVGCHNSRLGMANPDLTLTTPFGDSLVFGLCPSRPAVREYLVGLVADLADRELFDRIELETFDYFYGTGFGWHHDKFHSRLGTLGELLFGLCFCEECRGNAADAGVDVEEAQSTCRETIDAIAAGELPHDVDVAGWLQAHPEVADYFEQRMATLTDLYADLAAAAGGAELGAYLGFFGVEDAWMHGVDPDALASHVDYFTVIAYESTREDAVSRLRTARHLTDAPLHAGVLPGHPAIHDEATVVDVVDGLEAAGAERVSFYNYGLLPDRCLDWVGTATGARG